MAFDLDEDELRATRKMNKADRDEIEVNEYVRSKNGVIDKVESYSIGCCVWHCERGMCIDKCNCIGIHLEEIVKHSKQLIDLIEVGDFANGYRILAIEGSIYENSKRILIYKNQKEKYERWIYIQEYNGRIHTQDDIVEILTKERYMANCYKRREEKEI